MKVDLESSTPLYLQLKAVLHSAIETGELPNGSRLDPEAVLSEQFGVSRITVRHALAELTKEGLLERRRGKGTFVKPLIHRRLEYLMSFSESCAACGIKPSARVLNRSVEAPTAEDIHNLPSLEGTQLLHISRVRKGDKTPFIYENNYYPLPRYEFLNSEPLKGSLYQLLAQKHGIRVSRSTGCYLEVMRAGEHNGNILNVFPDEPLFYLYSVIFDDTGALVHIGKQYLVCARFRFYLGDFQK